MASSNTHAARLVSIKFQATEGPISQRTTTYKVEGAPGPRLPVASFIITSSPETDSMTPFLDSHRRCNRVQASSVSTILAAMGNYDQTEAGRNFKSPTYGPQLTPWQSYARTLLH